MKADTYFNNKSSRIPFPDEKPLPNGDGELLSLMSNLTHAVRSIKNERGKESVLNNISNFPGAIHINKEENNPFDRYFDNKDDMEEQLLQEMECHSDNQQMRELFELELSKLMILYAGNGNIPEEIKEMFGSMVSKAYHLMRIVKQLKTKLEGFEEANEKATETISKLIMNFRNKSSDLEAQIYDLQQENKSMVEGSDKIKAEINDLKAQLLMYKGQDTTSFQYMKIDQVKKVEKELMAALQNVSDHKHKIIEQMEVKCKTLSQNMEDSSRNCVICLNSKVEIVLQPCNHLCVCYECALQIDECPLDRGPLSGFQKVFGLH